MWRAESSWLALLELWHAGTLRRRKTQGQAWDELARLPWTRRTSRRDELTLVTARRGDLESLLERAAPGWRGIIAGLVAGGHPVDLHGWRAFIRSQKRDALPEALPERLNQRTATAAVGAHSKATLSDGLREALGPVEVTRDGLIRCRPNPGLVVERGDVRWDASELAALLGELALTERALRDGTSLAGRLPAAMLLVENVGPYMDLVAPDGWMVAHVPGWDTATLRGLLDVLPEVPVVHFGDLDPNGVRIVAHLQTLCPGLVWAVPEFWAEHVELWGLRKSWPRGLELEGSPELVRRLARDGVWLEQEALVLDARLREYLVGLL